MDLPQKMEKNHGFTTKNGEKQWIYHKKWRKTMDLPQKMEKNNGFTTKNGEKQWIYHQK